MAWLVALALTTLATAAVVGVAYLVSLQEALFSVPPERSRNDPRRRPRRCTAG